MTAVATCLASVIDASPIDMPAAELDSAVDLIETALERAGRRGLTPTQAGRAARVDTHTASLVLQWLAGRQLAYADTRRAAQSHYYAEHP